LAVQAVLIAGDDGVPVRVREELASLGVPTVSICSSAECVAARSAAAQGAALVIGEAAAIETWERAGAATARAVGLLGDNDLRNLSAGMLVGELNPTARIVLRMFSSDLASGIDMLLGGRGTVLSETEVAAPALVRAALSGNTGQRITLANHILEVAEVDRNDPRLVVALCNVDTPTAVLPARAELAEHVIGLVDPMAVVEGVRGALPSTVAQFHLNREDPRERFQRRRPPLRARLRATLALIPRRAFVLAGLIATVAAIATTVFTATDHLALLDALYFTVTTMATVGYGDVNLIGAPDWLKVFDIGLMAVSAVLLASVLAFVTDILVSTRIDRALGRFPRPTRDHVVVCGLGKAGARVIAGLHELQIPCVGVEQHPDAVGISVARQLEIPVVFGDARTPGTLAQLGIDRARAVMAVTSDDLANIECGLVARELNLEARVVMRIFDVGLAERLDRSVDLDLTRSVSSLAAPAFTAALLDQPLAEPVPLSNVALRVMEADVKPGSPLAGRTIHDIAGGRELRVLAIDGRWRPRDNLVIEPGATVAVVGTRSGCDAVVRQPG
jgi:Trk K+ transport system NAD-binding subunit